jgi:microcystin-dependent protein
MGQPYIGEIRMFGGNFSPSGWHFCDGTLLAISSYETLFQVIGTTYGGDGQTTFALPNLQGRLPLHMGSNTGITYNIGETAGVEEVTLTTAQIPIHTHAALVNNTAGTNAKPANNTYLSTDGPSGVQVGTYQAYTGNNQVQLDPKSIQQMGGSQPHGNMQPYLCVSFIISLFGIFPTPN